MAGNPEYTGGRLKRVFNLPSKAELGGGGGGIPIKSTGCIGKTVAGMD